MKTKENHPTCQHCGKPLGAKSVQGLCPACLMQAGWPTSEQVDSQGLAPAFVPPTRERLQELFPQLEILELIGRGGMGAVYQARQRNLDRLVALKILAKKADPDFDERFTREARALAKLSHPNIVAVHDYGQAGDLSYFVMEYVDGPNLRQVQQAGELKPQEALEIVPQICAALQYAHDEGIVHRDIKPENILLDRKGHVKIADFGLAKLLGQKPSNFTLTQDNQVMGTPHYMAPEQVEHPQDVDHRADIYSLGVVFYEMLTGELPLGKFAPPSRKVQVDVRLDEVVLRTLEKEPEQRYQQVSQIRTEVETIVQTPGASPQPTPQQGFEYRSRRTLWGLPLVHIARGLDSQTGKPKQAIGIIAIGDRAKGVIAMGGLAMGGLALGGTALGGICIGGCAVGLISLGGLALGLLAALGGGAVGTIAMGGGAWGYLAHGGTAWGVHVYDATHSDPMAKAFFEPWAMTFATHSVWLWIPFLALLMITNVGLPAWLEWRQKGHLHQRKRSLRQKLSFIFTIAMGIVILTVVTIFALQIGKLNESYSQRKSDSDRQIPQVTTIKTASSSNQEFLSTWGNRMIAMNEGDWRKALAIAYQVEALPPEQGIAVVREYWDTVTNPECRKQFLKAFTFKHHPFLVEVLDRGLNDPAPKVQAWALSYLKDVSLQDFSEDYQAGQAWLATRREQRLATVLIGVGQDLVTILQSEDPEIMATWLEAVEHSMFKEFPQIVVDCGLKQALEQLIQGNDIQLCGLALAATDDIPLSEDWVQRVLLPKLDPSEPGEVRLQAVKAIGATGRDWAVDALLDYLCEMVTEPASDHRTEIWSAASALAAIGSARAIPTMIAVIESDNTYDTVYGVGYFGLGKLTGVSYDEKHDGAWWRQWWNINKQRFSPDVQALEIPELSVPQSSLNPVPALWQDVGQCMKQLQTAADHNELMSMHPTFDQLNEVLDEMQGKNDHKAPIASQWKALTDTPITEITAQCHGMENTAEMCRDLAKGGRADLLPAQWAELQTYYKNLRLMLEKPTD